jgi:3-oxoacyl-[acyl-carrier-protein] synthase III
MRRAKLKLAMALGITKNQRAKINSVCSSLRMVLLAAKDMIASAGVPGLAAAMSGLLLVVDVVQVTTSLIA